MSEFRIGCCDLLESFKSWRLWTLLGWLEIRQRYARSKLGPFWLTLSMGVLVGSLGFVYGALLGQPLKDYLRIIATGFVVWNLLSVSICEGSQAYIVSDRYIKQIKTPRLIYVLQVIWRNFVIFSHNFIIVILMFLMFGVQSWSALIFFIPGLVLLLINAFWMAAFVGLMSARYRDLPQIVASLMQIAFYVTPILFRKEMLMERHAWIVQYNPFSYLINVAREPLLGNYPTMTSWVVSFSLATFGSFIMLMLTGRYHKRIPFWV